MSSLEFEILFCLFEAKTGVQQPLALDLALKEGFHNGSHLPLVRTDRDCFYFELFAFRPPRLALLGQSRLAARRSSSVMPLIEFRQLVMIWKRNCSVQLSKSFQMISIESPLIFSEFKIVMHSQPICFSVSSKQLVLQRIRQYLGFISDVIVFFFFPCFVAVV